MLQEELAGNITNAADSTTSVQFLWAHEICWNCLL